MVSSVYLFFFGGFVGAWATQMRKWSIPYLICVCESQTQINKNRITRSRLPLRVKKPVANRKYYLQFSISLLVRSYGCDFVGENTNTQISKKNIKKYSKIHNPKAVIMLVNTQIHK